ncbi:hypothetical protein L484_011608 [Morus notabilis]|uniref:Uncharacterized protein n=1 Tax=Morus notabilis TaxID=981085 RepID=W9RKR5_9ROSA|nr:hypothetical protein L484_011608 [Morus notabilis]
MKGLTREEQNGTWFWRLVTVFYNSSIGIEHTMFTFFEDQKQKSRQNLLFSCPPSFELGPGSVQNKVYYNIDFSRGHIAIKRFDAEVVDEAGCSMPLHETYLHHWILIRYRIRKDIRFMSALAPKETRPGFQPGGYLVYGVAHQHTAGVGSTLYGDVTCFCNSSLLCVEIPSITSMHC